jgi:hypothetical protein
MHSSCSDCIFEPEASEFLSDLIREKGFEIHSDLHSHRLPLAGKTSKTRRGDRSAALLAGFSKLASRIMSLSRSLGIFLGECSNTWRRMCEYH